MTNDEPTAVYLGKSIPRSSLECHLFSQHTRAPVCACYVLHTLLFLRNRVREACQTVVFNTCILVKIARILEKFLGLGVCFKFVCKVFICLVFFVFVFETDFPHCVVPSETQLLDSSHPPTSASKAAGVTDAYSCNGLTVKKMSVMLPKSRAEG